MRPFDCVIWDWNGTLADDLDAAFRATNDLLADYHKPPITLEQYYSYIDSPISRFYEHLFDLNEVPMTEIGRVFGEYYPKYFDALHCGAAELLPALREAGVRQVILSSSHRQSILRDAEPFGILPCFDQILAADDLLAEGKVERGLRWMAEQDIPRARMVLVGDTLHDYDTARAMGISCILCAFGHQAEADLKAAGVPVLRQFSELWDFLLPA